MNMLHPFSHIVVSNRPFNIVAADGTVMATVHAINKNEAGDAFAFRRFGIYSFSFLQACMPSLFAGASIREART